MVSLKTALFAFIAILGLAATPVRGGMLTEFGGGYLVPSYTSYILLPECKHVLVTDPFNNPRGQADSFSCGGHGPTAIIWPVAWENERETLRIGWFHMSHYFDNHGETQFNCICISYKFKWRER